MRVADKTTLLPSGGGPSGTSPVLIPKGTAVGYSIYHMHRMANLYGKNAHEFHPERWENTDLEKKVGWGFMPFHGGPRICLGSKFPRSLIKRYADRNRGFCAYRDVVWCCQDCSYVPEPEIASWNREGGNWTGETESNYCVE
jgi:hypothetical protein